MTPFRIIISFVVLSIIGIALVPKLSVDLNPREREPVLQVSFAVPRSSPELVEKLATSVFEGAFSQLSDLKKINSVSNYDRGSITLRFDKDADLEFKRFEISSIIRQVYPNMDASVRYPLITQSAERGREAKVPLLTYTLNGPFATFEIKKIAEDVLRSALKRFQEIEEIEIRGANDLQLFVTYDIQKLQAFQLSKSDIEAAISASFASLHPGTLTNSRGETFFLKIDQSLISSEQLENLLITNKAGKNIYLKDLARLTLEEAEPNSFYRINGNNSVTLTITNREGVNKILLAQNIKDALEDAKILLPAGFEVRLERDDTEFLEKELEKIYKRSGLSILILVVFIFLINRNVRYLLILFLGIIVNLCITGILLYLMKVDIHLYTLAGLTISFGLIVDNAIIMMDHLHRYKNRKVFLALLAASLTTIAALLIVFFLPDEDRKNLTEFAVVVSVMLGVSLLVALFFTPSLYALLFTGDKQNFKKLSLRGLRRRAVAQWYYLKTIAFLSRFRKTFVLLLLLLFGLPIFFLPAKWEGQEWYNSTIGSAFYQEEIRPVSDKLLGGSLRMFVRGVFEKSSYREAEKTRLYVSARLPFGNTLQQMDLIMREFENFLKGVEGIDQFVTYVQSGQNASIVITFKEAYEKSALPYQLKGRLSVKSTDWSGAGWNIYGVGQGFFTGSGGEGIPSFRVTLKGYNFNELERQADLLAAKLLQHKRIQEVNTNERLSYNEQKTEEYVLRLNQAKMALGGSNQFEVVQVLLDLSKPLGPSAYLILDEQQYGVNVKEQRSDSFSKYDLENRGLFSTRDRMIKVSNFGTLNKETTTNALHKEDRQYIRLVSFEYMGSAKFGNEFLDEVLESMKNEMPIGYSAKKETWSWDWNKAKRQYSLILVVIAGIFFITSVLFENIKQPIYIIAIIPIAFIGLFLIFSLFDFYFDQGGYAAFVLLGGLAVNAAIFIVNDLNGKKHGIYNRNIIKAAAAKAVPIMLTILSTCFGLLPFILEGQNEIFWFSLAIGTIGGLLFSVFGVFVVLPVFLWKLTNKKATGL